MKPTEILYEAYYDSPIGPIVIQASETEITCIGRKDETTAFCINRKNANAESVSNTHTDTPTAPCKIMPLTIIKETPLIKKAYEELMEYFSGKRKTFDLPLYAEGTVFQMQVWNALREIPYGETRSYKDIAIRIGRPKACRAVGGACHHNPILIMIPCHRVIGANGSMTGFGSGIPVKEQLLELEGTEK